MFWKHDWKGRKCWLPAISPFPIMFSALSKTNLNFSITFILSSANTLNVDQSKILLPNTSNTTTCTSNIWLTKTDTRQPIMLVIFQKIVNSLRITLYQQQMIGLVQTQGIFNPFLHNDTFWRTWETSLLKTLWEKEKLLVTSNFSFSHNVFYLFG